MATAQSAAQDQQHKDQPRALALGSEAHAAALAFLQTLLRIDTRNPPGNERPAVDAIASELRRYGIEPAIFEPAPGRANLVARLRATRPPEGAPKPALLLSGHLDVVGVEAERWTQDPFGGAIHDGCVWGRGALDMKGMVAMELAAFLHIARLGGPLERDLVLLVLADEEAGMRYGSRWMVENEPETIRAGYALNEFGAFSSAIGNHRIYPIGVAEKGFCWIELISRGRPGHASMPHEDNACVHLARALERLSRKPLARAVHPSAAAFIRSLASLTTGAEALALRALLNPLTARAALAAIRAREPDKAALFDAMLHLTVTPTRLEAGIKENVIPSTARALLDGRYPPGASAEDLVRRVRGELSAHIEARELESGPPTEAPTDTPLFRLLCETIERHDPGAKALPWLNVGFTDSAELSRLGVHCYGFFPLKLPPGFPFARLIHGHDERLPLASFTWGLEVLVDVVCRFVGVPNAPGSRSSRTE